ncbi:LytTR family DNA-binding domain-containing protein [Aquimarina litoralis]|uniref:LytTR family DNA-binding domain-containing protein n=1 Tax=Aquimarina litoralis TaxID=584605 RepID=UPI001C593707|nr:LytTR family DNA-binding domain-containing protein [Aquimarina litoralis]MBW1294775.1 LytTR family transcriptional regulator [Aquimarina litoralis]
MNSLKLNTSYKHHAVVGLIMSLWLISFLVLIAPFDIAELPFLIRLEILPFYGFISLLSYLILIPIQNWVYHKWNTWSIYLEIILILVFNILVLTGSFLYYKTELVNGEYSFTKFSLEVYTPIFLVLLPILLISRWYLNKKHTQKEPDSIILKGENRLDILKLTLEDLICISSADNYVEVSYILNNELSTKLLRTTLKTVHSQLPQLLKTHRSHLINPIHFKEWKNSNTILVTYKEIPVSKKYINDVRAMNHSPLKTNHSSLSV